MKSAIIYYFSGTGNTELVANMIKEAFSDHEYKVDLIRMEDILKNNSQIDLEAYDLIGIGSQVIGFGVPHLAGRFMHVLPKTTGKKVFIFRTAGGVAPQNYNASKPMIRELSRKGYEVVYERLFSISSNWVVRFDDNVVKQLYEATRKKVKIMCEDIIRGDKQILKTSMKMKILMEVVMFFSSKMLLLVGKDYKVNKSCTQCENCIKICPAGNIYRKKDRIKFGLACSACMRCIYSCPRSAINLRLFKFFCLPTGYNIKETLENPTKLAAKGIIPPFSKDYINGDL